MECLLVKVYSILIHTLGFSFCAHELLPATSLLAFGIRRSVMNEKEILSSMLHSFHRSDKKDIGD